MINAYLSKICRLSFNHKNLKINKQGLIYRDMISQYNFYMCIFAIIHFYRDLQTIFSKTNSMLLNLQVAFHLLISLNFLY